MAIGVSAKRVAVILVVVVVGVAFASLLGMRLGWWGYATTELGVVPDESGGVVIYEPLPEDFTTEAAWAAYEENWRDPYWEGERPEGFHCKSASFVNEDVVGYRGNLFIAGCVGWMFLDYAEETDAEEVARAAGAPSHYLLSANRTGGAGDSDERTRQLLLLYFDEDADLWAKVGEVDTDVGATAYGSWGFAQLVTPDEVSVYQ